MEITYDEWPKIERRMKARQAAVVGVAVQQKQMDLMFMARLKSGTSHFALMLTGEPPHDPNAG
jgi:hypothetical protein